MAFGSGFVIDAEGRIASNLHVLAGASSASVRFVNQSEKFAVRSVSAFSFDWDLVILRIDKNSTPLATGDSTRLQIGDRVLAFGNPEGLEGTVSEGIVSALRKLDGEIPLIQITAAISPGSSGGPVIDRDGKITKTEARQFAQLLLQIRKEAAKREAEQQVAQAVEIAAQTIHTFDLSRAKLPAIPFSTRIKSHKRKSRIL